MSMKIYLGADHKGFVLKEKLSKWLYEQNLPFYDVGASGFDPDDDYTIYAQEVSSMVANEREALGILICGSGVGMGIVANKFDGVRAGIGKNAAQVKAGRADDDMNILVLAADHTSEEEARQMFDAFLGTEFSKQARFKKRLDDIEKIEANN